YLFLVLRGPPSSCSFLSLYRPHPPRHLPSFPTRRSSDLFIRGIDDRGLQHANGLRGNSLVDQDACAVNLFAFVSESHSLQRLPRDRKSTRLNSSHLGISYAVFCLKKKKREFMTLVIETTA